MRRLAQIASIVPVAIAGVLACASMATAASSTPPMTVTIEQPSGATTNYFQVSGRPGASVRAGNVLLHNQTGKRIKVLLDPVRGLTASTLGSAYGLRGTKQGGSASWVSIASRRVTLSPHGNASIPVSVRVPAGAHAGDYLAGVGVQPAKSAQDLKLKGNVAISQVQRYAVGLLTRIPGPRHPQIKLTGVGLSREPSGVTFSIKARNTGNVILKNVEGVATVSDGDDQIAQRSIGPGTFVTDTSIAYPLLVPSLGPSVGTAFRVKATLRYRGGVARIDRVVTFGAVDAKRQAQYGGPPAGGGGSGKLIALIAALLLLIGGALAYLRLRRQRRGAGEAALRRALPVEIQNARATREPLSVTLVAPDNGHSPSRLASGVRESLRPRDRLFQLDSGLVVISPATNPEAGEILAADIRRNLTRTGLGGTAVIPITSAAESSPEELLEAAEAIGAHSPRGNGGRAGNGGNGASVANGAQDEVKQDGTEASVGGRERAPHA